MRVYFSLYQKIPPFQDYFFTECEELGGTWGQELDCGEKPVGGECGSGADKDCHGYGHQVYIHTLLDGNAGKYVG